MRRFFALFFPLLLLGLLQARAENDSSSDISDEIVKKVDPSVVAIQHENDHLDGKLMIDHLSLLRRRLVHRAMVKRAAADAAARGGHGTPPRVRRRRRHRRSRGAAGEEGAARAERAAHGRALCPRRRI